MAQLTFTKWSKLVVKVWDESVSPAAFKAMCTINSSRGITFNANVSEDAIPDCDDLQKVQWLIREKVSLSADISGSGRVDRKNVKLFFDWWRGEDPKQCQVVLDDPTPANVITFEGDYHCTTFGMNGDPGSPAVTGDISLQSTGEVVGEFGANVGGS